MPSAVVGEVVAGRYLVVSEIASGGMATVFLGRMLGPAGFSKVVALKRLHPHLAKEPEFVSMFLEEARLAARVRHANVVSTLDVVSEGNEIVLVMEYVLGESVSTLLRAAKKGAPPEIAVAIAAGMLEGLHAAHEARGDHGEPLGIVHRDVSPQNVLVGADGTPRVVDFGIAKAAGRAQETRDGQVKGKACYMPPEQARGAELDRRADIYSAGVVLWELLTGRRLFVGSDPYAIAMRVVEEPPPPPSRFAPVPAAVDAAVLRALAKDPSQRFPTAHAFADALEHSVGMASARAVARWVDEIAHDRIATRESAMKLAVSTPGVAFAPAPRASFPSVPANGADDRRPSLVPTQPTETSDFRPHLRVLAFTGAALGAAVIVALVRAALSASTPADFVPPAQAITPPATVAPAVSGLEDDLVAPSVATTASNAAPVLVELDDAGGRSLAPAGSMSAQGTKPSVRAHDPAQGCNPPWTLGPDGIRVLKPKCR